MQEKMPHLFLSEYDELNGEFWGSADDDYNDSVENVKAKLKIDKPYNDDLKSDNW